MHELLAYGELVGTQHTKIVTPDRRSASTLDLFAYSRDLGRDRRAVVHRPMLWLT